MGGEYDVVCSGDSMGRTWLFQRLKRRKEDISVY